MEYVDQTFTDEEVEVDGNLYRNCRFVKCGIVFRANSIGVQFNGCSFDACAWQLAGPALQTMHYLHTLYRRGPHGANVVEDWIRQVTGSKPH